jgi:hypothetical protein
MFWVPQNGSIGMGLSILSYNGHVHFGLIADGKLVADPEPLVQHFAREVEKITLAVMMEDWGTVITSADAAATMGRFESDMHGLHLDSAPAAAVVKSKVRAAKTKALKAKPAVPKLVREKPKATVKKSAAARSTAASGSKSSASAFDTQLRRFRSRGT